VGWWQAEQAEGTTVPVGHLALARAQRAISSSAELGKILLFHRKELNLF